MQPELDLYLQELRASITMAEDQGPYKVLCEIREVLVVMARNAEKEGTLAIDEPDVAKADRYKNLRLYLDFNKIHIGSLVMFNVHSNKYLYTIKVLP